TTQLYEVQDNALDAFYLGLTLNYKEIFTSKEISLKWKEPGPKDLVGAIVTNLNTDFLKPLLDKETAESNEALITTLNE
ncbi:hypothetical protein BgiMline_012119, partial [Biomphalaria glabrata]